VDGLLATTDKAIAGVGSKSKDANKAGKDLGGGFGQGITDAQSQVNKQALQVAQGGADAAAPARHEYNDAGQGFSRGMANGIGDAGGQVATAARKVAQDAVDAARATLAAKSPSAVTREQVGVPFSQGIAAGIAKAAPDVHDAASAVFAPITAPGGVAVGPFTPGVGSGLGGVTLSPQSIDQLANAITSAPANNGPRGPGLVIENAVIGDTGVLADLDFFSRKVSTALVAGN